MHTVIGSEVLLRVPTRITTALAAVTHHTLEFRLYNFLQFSWEFTWDVARAGMRSHTALLIKIMHSPIGQIKRPKFPLLKTSNVLYDPKDHGLTSCMSSQATRKGRGQEKRKTENVLHLTVHWSTSRSLTGWLIKISTAQRQSHRFGVCNTFHNSHSIQSQKEIYLNENNRIPVVVRQR